MIFVKEVHGRREQRAWASNRGKGMDSSRFTATLKGCSADHVLRL